MGCAASKEDPWALCQAGALGSLVQWLDMPGSSVDAVDLAKGRGSLLHAAAAADQRECVKLLVKGGANVDLTVLGLGTPLHAAAAAGANSAVALLLASGASPTAQHEGRTAAEVAQARGFPATADLIRKQSPKSPATPKAVHGGSKSPNAGNSTPFKPSRKARDHSGHLSETPSLEPPPQPAGTQPKDAGIGADQPSSSEGGSACNSKENTTIKGDPLLEIVRLALLSRPPPDRSGTAHGNGSEQPGGIAGAAGQRTKPSSQQAHQGQSGSGAEATTPDANQRSNGGGGSANFSSGLDRRSACRATVDVSPWIYDFTELEMEQNGKTLGSGSYGRVYAAKLHETMVAVKVLLDVEEVKNATGPGAVWNLSHPILSNLKKESTLMASLLHPNIVQFLGVCTQPPAVITEYCARGSLADVLSAANSSAIKLRQLTWLRRLSMALDAATGMLFLHMKGIVHRDLKSPNLLVDKSWKVKVADFNLSKILDTDTGSGRSALENMNPRWLAPEILDGAPASRASDVFSWGVVMWEILTLELPWLGKSTWSLVGKLKQGVRLEVPADDKIPGYDTPNFQGLDDYITLMKRCWLQHPQERPSFKDIVVQLRSMLDAQIRAAGALSRGWQQLLPADSGVPAPTSPLAGGGIRAAVPGS